MGGTPLLGYDVDGQSRLQVNEAEAAQVREIYALFVSTAVQLSGLSERLSMAVVGPWQAESLIRWIGFQTRTNSTSGDST